MRKPGTFVKGDPRINRKGRPPKIDQLQRDLKELASETVEYELKSGETITTSRYMAILLNIIEGALSGDPQDKKLYLEYMFGKPMQPVEVGGTLEIPAHTHERETLARKLIDVPSEPLKLNAEN